MVNSVKYFEMLRSLNATNMSNWFIDEHVPLFLYIAHSKYSHMFRGDFGMVSGSCVSQG